jgi:hypothetical protein
MFGKSLSNELVSFAETTSPVNAVGVVIRRIGFTT